LAKKYSYGPLDPDTEELFSTMMNFAQRFIDLQVDEDSYRELQEELDELVLKATHTLLPFPRTKNTLKQSQD